MSKEAGIELTHVRIDALIKRKKQEYNRRFDPHTYGKRNQQAVERTTTKLFSDLSMEVIKGVATILEISITDSEIKYIADQLLSTFDWHNIPQLLLELQATRLKSEQEF